MEILKQRKRVLHPHFWNIFFPAVVFPSVLAVDHFFITGVILTPVCNIIVIAILALKAKPWPMAFWCVLSVGLSIFTLTHPHFVRADVLNPIATTFTRSISAIAGGLMGLMLCIHRSYLNKDFDNMLELLDQMPMPFLLSDENGEVVFVNDRAVELLNISKESVMGDSIFSLLENIGEKGNSIQRYLAVMDSKSKEKIITKYRPRTKPGVVIDGESLVVEAGGLRRMVTMLSPVKSDAAKPAVSAAP